jgi:tetratricopeptide (TPR) repeat protein
VVRALPSIWKLTVEDTQEAQRWLTRALELDPNYAYAHALMGWTYMKLWGLLGGSQQRELLGQSAKYARTAAQLDEREPWVYLVTGLIHTRRREPDQAVAALRKALDLNPNFVMAHAYLGYALGVSGQAEAGAASLDRAVRLSPRDPFLTSDYMTIRAMIAFALGLYDEAITLCHRIIRDRPDHIGAYRLMTICYSLLGKEDEARRWLAEVLRLHPTLRVADEIAAVVYTDPHVSGKYVEGLRLAGLPE